MRLHHMLLFLAHKFPDLQKDANNAIERFMKEPKSRLKSVTKDLGRFDAMI